LASAGAPLGLLADSLDDEHEIRISERKHIRRRMRSA
jgi:hypothetical protein